MHKKTAEWIHKVLHTLEVIIALITLVVLVGMLILEVYRMFTVADYFASIDHYLHNRVGATHYHQRTGRETKEN